MLCKISLDEKIAQKEMGGERKNRFFKNSWSKYKSHLCSYIGIEGRYIFYVPILHQLVNTFLVSGNRTDPGKPH